ncbi:MAG TPA: PRC-barrel domain-containing protein [Thermomicrobiales bacterium]|nr:PRC-barrel domain-containing protein [Thermomicrobiales bacterium]
MSDTRKRTLVKLGDTTQTVADPAEDIRGRDVIDRDGEDIGKVDALMIDEDEGKVRFLQVKGGGFLGIGDETVLIPVDAITRIEGDRVYVDQTRERVAGGPRYDPDLAEQPTYWESASAYYGYGAYWGPGYAYPAYPLYGAGAMGMPVDEEPRVRSDTPSSRRTR